MPITSRNAPRPASARLIAHVTDMLREKKSLPGARVEMRLEKMSHSEPHPVYYVTLDALAQGKLLDAATQTSWRYLLVQDDAAIAEAELSAGGKSTGKLKSKRASAKPLTFLGVSHGPFTDATVDALHAAERLPKVAAADYELRLLKIPAVYLAALWLHRADDDILIPMANPPGGLRKNKPYTEKQVIRALKPVVEQTKQFHDAYEQNKRKRPRARKS
jgi:hypothetical protein